MSALFFSGVRFAGMNVGLLLVTMLVLVILAVVAWRIVLWTFALLVALMLLPIGLLAIAIGPPRTPIPEEKRLVAEQWGKNLGRFITKSLQFSDGGAYGRQKRGNKAWALRAADPEGHNHRLWEYMPGGSRFNRADW